MNELTTITDKLVFKPAKITFDDADLKTQLIELKSKYEGLVVSESNLKDSKRTATMLNGIANELDNARKSVKKEYNKPLKEFEGKVNDVRDEVRELRQNIVDQVGVFEEKEKMKRKEAILTEIREEIAPNYNISDDELEMISSEFKPDWWEKKTYQKKKRLEEIATLFTQFNKEKEQRKNNLQLIKLKLDSYDMADHYQSIKYDYIDNDMNIEDVLEKIDRLHEDIETKKTIEKAKVEEVKENLVEHNGQSYNQETGEKVQIMQEITFTLQGSKEDIDQVAMLISDLGLKVLGKPERKEIIVND
nr:MAG TPA: Protein of unknown function (DUF1351) [Caudoviricetes sp.]